MKLKLPLLLHSFAVFAGLLVSTTSGFADSILRSAGDFTLLGGTGITSTGVVGTVIRNGNVGLSPGATTGITGFPPAVIENGAIIATGPVTAQARLDLMRAQVALAGLPSNANLSTVDLGGKTLAPGVYTFNGEANLNGDLVLDGQGKNNVFWVFQIGTALTSSINSTVRIINPGTNGGRDYGIFWNAGSAINIGANNEIAGNYLAGTSIVFGDGSGSGGRALALAAISLDNNRIDAKGGPGGSDWSGGLMFDRSGKAVPAERLSFSYIGKRYRVTARGNLVVRGRASLNATSIQWRANNGRWRTVRISEDGSWRVNTRPLRFGRNLIQFRALDGAGAITAINRLSIRRTARSGKRAGGRYPMQLLHY